MSLEWHKVGIERSLQVCIKYFASCCTDDMRDPACARVIAEESALLTAVLWLFVQELFSPFGPISRVYIAYDRETGENRGFAFVNFVYRYAAPWNEYKLAVC